ncbi:MAG: hypothetical protein KDD45_14280 [Bdellovibrionales bacterium]|nr:hypothetical protein [Bdellovibrionales bacterium]
MKSTAGTGIATPLVDEASFLNPSTLAFFNMSALYIQKTNADTTINDANTVESDSFGVVASDTKGSMKGNISYIKQSDNDEERKQFAASIATMAGKNSSFGMTYKRINEVINGEKEEYNVSSFGVSHFVNRDFSMGVVVNDPFQVKPHETRAIVGLQYMIKDYISLMVDGGADYNKELSTSSLVRGAAQFKVYNDFFIRFGASEDKGRKEKSTGAGFTWVQPKLIVNFAIKNTTLTEDAELNQESEKIKETSFSLSYRF